MMRKRRVTAHITRLFFSLAVVLLSACAEFQDKPINPIESAKQLETRTLNDPELLQFIASVTKHSVKSWDINNLTLAALYFHTDVALANAVAESAKASIITAGQRPNPTISISPTWISNLATGAIPWIIVGSVNVPIETAGKRAARVAKAEHLTEAARLRVIDTVWQVRARLRLALLELFAAQRAESLLQQQVFVQQKITQRIAQQLTVGELAPDDLNRAQLVLGQLQINQAAAQKRQLESRVLLAAAIGVPVTALSEIALDFSQFAILSNLSAVPIEKLRSTALQQRPDILAALADYAAAQAALQLEIANQYPNIQVNPAYTWETGEHRWTLGGSALQLPVLHQNQGAIGEAETKRVELDVRFTALQLRIISDIDRVRAGLTASKAKWDAAEQQRTHEQDHLESAQGLLKAGEVDALAVLAAELEILVTERVRLDVLIENQQAAAAMEDVLRYPITFIGGAELGNVQK
jgi:outer membrane protein TolC